MAISKKIGDQETFRLIELDGCGVYALEAYNNAYVSVRDGDELVANQDHIQEWERFHIVQEGDHFFLIAQKNERYVSMDFSGDQHLRANKEQGLDWEKFIIGTLDDALNWETFKIESQKT